MIDSFRNRLQKNDRHFRKWAKRRGITCYRLYDRDIPEFPFIVDRYEEHIHVQTLRDDDIPPEIATAVAEVLDAPPELVHTKKRSGQKDAQYEKTGERGDFFVVHEGGHRFLVNLDAYLDTGLFLDHRPARTMIGERAKGKRFLNLFAYTGSFTVYAAAGAPESVTVDLSNTYLDWAKKNFELNGMPLSRHSLVRNDAMAYLEDAVRRREHFDLIVLDPPTFSNSKKMQSHFDVQQDHVKLIRYCMHLLNPGGELFFSNNLRSFKLDQTALAAYHIVETSPQTVPEDFRNKKIHRSWLFSRQGEKTA